MANGNCSHICVNEYPSYHCDCPPGGQLDPTNLTCVFNANCSTLSGCECLPGYSDSTSNQSVNCTGECFLLKYVMYMHQFHYSDIDECASGGVICMENFQCINTEGSYACVCNNGYFLNTDNVTCCKFVEMV